MSRCRRQSLVPFIWGLVLCISASRATADSPTLTTGQAAFMNAVRSLRPQPSLETNPIEFSVGRVHYRMPRNYLTTMDNWSGGPQGLVTVTVNIPDMKPLSVETQACFTVKATDRPPGCEPLSFTINAGSVVSAGEALTNIKRLFHFQHPETFLYGFQMYKIGPENAGTEFYTKFANGRRLLFACQIFDNHGKRDGLCDPVGDRLPTGAALHFFIALRHLKDIAQIDDKLRNLTEEFTVRPREGE